VTAKADDDSAPREKLHSLLMQCSIQTQLGYYNEFKNELSARWLESFLGHEHLRVKRTASRKGGGSPSYRGVKGSLRCSWRDYLRTMLRAAPQKYEVRYKVGTADTAGSLAEAGADASAGSGYLGTGQEAPWAAASRSRAANPYLKKQATYRTFEEVVDPKRVARGLMAIRAQLAAEWERDLAILGREGGYISDRCAEEEACELLDAVNPNVAQANAGDAAVDDPFSELPAVVTTVFRGATLEWSQQEDLDDEFTSSPFRELNFDLLQRALSREAALSVLSALNEKPENAASAGWLRAKLEAWLPRFESPSRSFLGAVFLVELLSASPAPITAADGTVGLADPAKVAADVIWRREAIAAEWGGWLEDAQEANDELLREALEEQLKSQAEP